MVIVKVLIIILRHMVIVKVRHMHMVIVKVLIIILRHMVIVKVLIIILTHMVIVKVLIIILTHMVIVKVLMIVHIYFTGLGLRMRVSTSLVIPSCTFSLFSESLLRRSSCSPRNRSCALSPTRRKVRRHTNQNTLYSCIYMCLECRVSWIRVPPETPDPPIFDREE